MKVVMGQLNTWVGDLQGNTDKVIKTALAVEQQEEPIMLVFPELTLTGYPPEDLLMRESLHDQIEVALQRLASELPPELYVVVGSRLLAICFCRKGRGNRGMEEDMGEERV